MNASKNELNFRGIRPIIEYTYLHIISMLAFDDPFG